MESGETFCLFMVELTPLPSLHSTTTRNACFLVFLSQRLLWSFVMRRFQACKLLLSGDVELSPGPESDQAQQLAEMLSFLHDVRDRSVKV